ncbi:MAG: hypothetical protein ABIP06_04450 [Pyrinomonadaceae bacterium]
MFGLFGIGTFLIGDEKSNTSALRQSRNVVAVNNQIKPETAGNFVQTGNKQIVQQTANKIESNANNNRVAVEIRDKDIEQAKVEKVYYCGAATKKGTPCSRKVKGGGRCWQHTGQEAILPPEKLLITQ